VGGIDYLNASPLIRYLSLAGDPPLSISNHSPAALATLLRDGELDLALAPAVEYLARADYKAIPGICISSYGAVESIRLYHRKPLKEIQVAGIDTSSRSSALLLRLLFRDLWRGGPRFVPLEAAEAERWIEGALYKAGGGPGSADSLDAFLLIGDKALQCPRLPGWEVLDLGTEWTRWTGLPFVYAFWIWRGEAVPPRLVERLEQAKRVGLARIDDIVSRLNPNEAGSLSPSQCRDYLRRAIQYDFGPPQVEGLISFFSLLERNGLVSAAPRPLVFVSE
jgi:chorismate dehydratase